MSASRAGTAAALIVEALVRNGVRTVFGVPGESYLAILDALCGGPVRYVTCRQEGGAAMMAAASGRLTGVPGACMVTRGPGAANASAGVHVAFQDSLPMILFVGQVARSRLDREAFQEIDYRRMFGQMAKWVAEIDDPARTAEYVSEAFHVACSGRPGPVVLALPEDMLSERVPFTPLPAARRADAAPSPAALEELRGRLAAARRPFLLIGGGGWTAEACADVQAFAEANDLPAGVSFRRQDLFDNEHPNYAGHVGIGIDPGLAEAVRESDLLLVAGSRLGEMTTGGYQLIEAPRPAQTLVHIHASAEELGRVYFPDLPVNADPRSAAAALRALGAARGKTDGSRTARLHAGYLAFSEPAAPPAPSAMNMANVVSCVRRRLPEKAIICNGAGNYAIWVHRFFRYRRFGTQLAPTSGSMGFGTPAALAAALARPGVPVVAFSGDGCFMMTAQEFASAVQHRVKFVQIVVNNGMHGTIRMHQERRYPGRVSGSDIGFDTDYAALARAMGGSGETVFSDADFPAAFERALESPAPALIEIRADPEALTPTSALSGGRLLSRGERMESQ
jgi:acetolactate synthase-1/2/3 large subunit